MHPQWPTDLALTDAILDIQLDKPLNPCSPKTTPCVVILPPPSPKHDSIPLCCVLLNPVPNTPDDPTG